MATLKDIAKSASFSVSTVSAVLRGDAEKLGICAETVEKIRRTAAEIGYVKNDYARTMASGKSRVLAFITDTGRNVEYQGKLLSGVLEEASAHDYSLRIFDYKAQSENELLSKLLSLRIKGVLISGDLLKYTIEKIVTLFSQHNICCATLNHSNQICGIGAESDDVQGMSEMVEYIYGAGHRKIAYYGVMNDEEYAQKRLNGYLRSIEKYGLKSYIYQYSAKVKLKDMIKNGLTAVIGESDYMGAVLLQQAYSDSIKVPEEISICGFAGMEVSTFAARPMTTVVQDFIGMGKSAAQMLINVLEKKDFMKGKKTLNTKLKTELKIQQTTGKI